MKFLLSVVLFFVSFSVLSRVQDEFKGTFSDPEHTDWVRCRQLESPEVECKPENLRLGVRVQCGAGFRLGRWKVGDETPTVGYMPCPTIAAARKNKNGAFAVHADSLLYSDESMKEPKTAVGVNKNYQDCEYEEGNSQTTLQIYGNCPLEQKTLCMAKVRCHPHPNNPYAKMFGFGSFSTRIACRAIKLGGELQCPSIRRCIMDQSLISVNRAPYDEEIAREQQQNRQPVRRNLNQPARGSGIR